MKEQKTLLVTGASSEIGSRLIRDAADHYEVILAHYCQNADVLVKLKNEIGDHLVLLQADFSKLEEVSAIIQSIDQMGYMPDHIVHLPSQKVNAQKFHKTDIQQYRSGYDLSVASIILILQHFIPKMSRQHYGKIIFMLTSFTLQTPAKYQAPYITTKYALLGLMRDLAGEYAEKGIMVNAISPDMIQTKFLSDMPELIIQQNAAQRPMRRNLTVEDVVPLLLYLLSDCGNVISGQNFGM